MPWVRWFVILFISTLSLILDLSILKSIANVVEVVQSFDLTQKAKNKNGLWHRWFGPRTWKTELVGWKWANTVHCISTGSGEMRSKLITAFSAQQILDWPFRATAREKIIVVTQLHNVKRTTETSHNFGSFDSAHAELYGKIARIFSMCQNIYHYYFDDVHKRSRRVVTKNKISYLFLTTNTLVQQKMRRRGNKLI